MAYWPRASQQSGTIGRAVRLWRGLRPPLRERPSRSTLAYWPRVRVQTLAYWPRVRVQPFNLGLLATGARSTLAYWPRVR
ncbi:MAG: hypothetical protein F6J98_32810, partial [Moorea sp. SIO4G2]|nr:hypothetical protein [Moorena sp. SIO4G2]